jgi:hypothetical protein
MTLEQQVCSLDLAKRLKELGVRQESVCKWVLRYSTWVLWDEGTRSEFETGAEKEYVSAFTVAELGEMLPKEITRGDITTAKCAEGFEKGRWLVAPIDTNDEEGAHDWNDPAFYGNTEADARAKMLIHLIEHDTIEADEINVH